MRNDESRNSGSSELLDLIYIFKIEPTGLTESLDVGCEKKIKKPRMTLRVLAPANRELELSSLQSEKHRDEQV